jgi:hypothetical protein
MKRLLAFLTVLTVTSSSPQARILGAEEPSGKRLEFRAAAMGEIIDGEATMAGFRTDGWDKTHLGTTLFNASDGEKLSIYYASFSSSHEARRYFDWKVARGGRILKQGAYTDAKTKSVGQRAEVLLAGDEKRFAVMWTSGSRFREIIARSLSDALELERQYRHQ